MNVPTLVRPAGEAAPAGRPVPGAAAQRVSAPTATPSGHGAFVPVLLLALTLLGWLGAQLYGALLERDALRTAFAAQQQAMDNAAKMRASLDALAADTQRMADAGNANAGLLVAELRKRGITINPSANAASAPGR